MRSKVKTILVVLALLVGAGCGSKGYVDARKAKALVEPVVQRHDQYVKNDPAKSEADKATDLRSSQMLMEGLNEAIGPEDAKK